MAHQRTDPATGAHTALGIDIGGTGMKGGVVQLGADPEAGQLIGKRFRIPTPQPAVPATVADVLGQITAELDSRTAAPPETMPAGVCFPAAIQNGICRTATNIDRSWIGTDVDALFSDHLKRPVATLNDADAAGLAEVRFGAGKGVPGTVLVLTLGTGIGGGLFRDGELVPNLEPGTIELDGAIAEQRASAAARERDGLDWPEYAERLQRYFSYVEGIFYPDLIIVGGGISKRPEDYIPLLRLRTPIVPAALKNNAGIVGAALWATDALAQSYARTTALDTARQAADREMARRAEADLAQEDLANEEGQTATSGKGAAGKSGKSGKAGKGQKADESRKAGKDGGEKAARLRKKADKAAKRAAKAERKAAQEAKTVNKAMEKAIRRSSR
jgi:polyphosphate glucokinase